MLLGDTRTQSFNFTIVINLSIPPLMNQSLNPAAQAPSSLSLHACMDQFSTVRFLAPTSALKHFSRSACDRVTQSLSQTRGCCVPCDAQNATCRRAVEVIIVNHAWSLAISGWYRSTSQASLSLSLSLSLSTTHKKTLTHNIPGASAPGIIMLICISQVFNFLLCVLCVHAHCCGAFLQNPASGFV